MFGLHLSVVHVSHQEPQLPLRSPPTRLYVGRARAAQPGTARARRAHARPRHYAPCMWRRARHAPPHCAASRPTAAKPDAKERAAHLSADPSKPLPHVVGGVADHPRPRGLGVTGTPQPERGARPRKTHPSAAARAPSRPRDARARRDDEPWGPPGGRHSDIAATRSAATRRPEASPHSRCACHNRRSQLAGGREAVPPARLLKGSGS